MNLFQESKKVLDKDGNKVNALGPIQQTEVNLVVKCLLTSVETKSKMLRSKKQ